MSASSLSSQNPRRRALAWPIGANGDAQGAASVERVLRRLHAAHAGTERQARPFAESAPLRFEDRKAGNESDADDQRAAVRDQTLARAIRSYAGKGDASRAVRAQFYVSADQRERVAKAAITREETKVIAEIKKLRASGEHVPSNSPDKRRHGSWYPITADAERRYRDLRRRKLAGQHIPDGEWHWMIDYARRFKDPRYELLRGSPGAFGFSLIV